MIAVTGATGNLGRLVVEDLLDRGIPPGEIVAAVRRPEKASDLAERGVAVREADYAAAAATVLTGDGHEGEAYELGGDRAFTMDELAAEITGQSGTEVVYRDLPPDEYRQALVDAGLPGAQAEAFADADQGIAEGHLHTDSEDLRRLIGRPTTPMAEAVEDALGA